MFSLEEQQRHVMSIGQATDIRNYLLQIFKNYGTIGISDYRELLYPIMTLEDYEFGWNSVEALKEIKIEHLRDDLYYLRFPEPVKLQEDI